MALIRPGAALVARRRNAFRMRNKQPDPGAFPVTAGRAGESDVREGRIDRTRNSAL